MPLFMVKVEVLEWIALNRIALILRTGKGEKLHTFKQTIL